MKRFSLLDLSPIPEGHTAGEALSNTVSLAKAAETFGYHRYWLAEHHNMPGIASAATSIVISQVASATHTMRVGAGGIMLPNHAPLVIAEQFGTLATLYPDRIDLGLGRAPGSDMATARALRRHMVSDDSFPRDVLELIGYLAENDDNAAHVRAIPGTGTKVPTWLLGSSLFGAKLAAQLGLPYAFASHFAPAMLQAALLIYRQSFRPSQWLDAPYTMIGVGVCAAETDGEANYLRTSQVQAFANLITGCPGKLPTPVENLDLVVPGHIQAQALQALSCSATGSPVSIKLQLETLIEKHKPDEIILSGMIYNHSARVRSFEIAAKALSDLCDHKAAA